MEKFATIDLGSNTVRLVIFEVYDNGSYKMVENLADSVRLSHGMKKDGRLSDESMKRADETIRVFADFCSNYNVPFPNIYAVATAAVRQAENGLEFTDSLKARHGIDFRILTGEEEALYALNAVRNTFDYENGLVIDIGGGSTELVLFRDRKPVGCVSFPYGCISATEMFLGQDMPPSAKSIKLLTEKILYELKQLDWLKPDTGFNAICIGGTTRALGKIQMKSEGYPFPRINNYIIPFNGLQEIQENLASKNRSEMSKVPGLSSDREDVILGGLIILKTICEYVGSKQLILSGSGLREGIFFESMHRLGRLPVHGSALEAGISNFMLLYSIRMTHAEHVKKLSLRLFRCLTPLHGYGPEMEKYLGTAALLHDSGIYISYYDRSRHSLYLILNSGIPGLDHSELMLIAVAASGLTERDTGGFVNGAVTSILTREELKTAKLLSLIIGIAEAFDKSETGCIEDLECDLKGRKVVIRTVKAKDASLELKSAAEFGKSFRKLLKASMEIH